MGIIRKMEELRKNTREKAKKELKKNIRKVILKALMQLLVVLKPFLIVGIIAIVGVSLMEWIVKIFTAENNPELLYETLEVEDVSDLVEIKGDETNGYYLDFIEDIDEKLEEIIKKYNKSEGYYPLPEDIEFLKNMLKAEVFTQFPDLNGTIPR